MTKNPTQSSLLVELNTDRGHQFVIREVERSRIGLQLGVGLLGLGVIAGGIASGYLIDTGMPVIIPILAVGGVIGFGLAVLLSWRKSGEFEIIEIVNGRIRLVMSATSRYAFDAPVADARLQRVKHSLGMRLALRDSKTAVEVAVHLTPEQREFLADRVDTALARARGSDA